MKRTGFHTLFLLAVSSPLIHSAEPAKTLDAEKLAGVWLADSAEAEMDRPLSRVWFSKFTVEGKSFRVSKLMFHTKDLTGTFTLDPTTNPKSIDLKLNELDYSELGIPAKIPAMTLPGIYKLDRDRVTLCFHSDPDLKRPTEFAVRDKKTVILSLGRADPKYTGHPKEVTVTVKGPDGKPAPMAMVYYTMSWDDSRANKDGKSPTWRFTHGFPAGADGVIKVPYEEIGHTIKARDANRKLIGYTTASPFSLQSPAVTVHLEPEVLLTGTLVSEDLKKAALPIGWTNAQVYWRGIIAASCMTTSGKFELPVPPGEYVIEAYGEDLLTKKVPIRVPAGKAKFDAPPINLTATMLPILKGKPAPELTGVVGWKGEKVKIADLKGKYVLLEFWGYWCSPCVAAMPTLFELHDKFKDKGLAIIGVHLDVEGEIDTVAKLDEKLVDIRKRLWKGRELPFPVAMCSGKQEDVPGGKLRHGGAQYGVLSYPTTILIDREGKVVGRFRAREGAEAVREVEKLLGGK